MDIRKKFTKEQLAKAEALRPYENQWVALVDDTVVASGESLEEVKEKAEEGGYTDCVFHLVPSFSVHYVPSAWRV